MSAWESAEVQFVARHGASTLAVLCPFCREQHVHNFASAGSAEVLAGCHTGRNGRLRVYAIPELPKGKK